MNWLQRVMYGRHGVDQLSLFLMAVYMGFYALSGLLGAPALQWLGLVCLGLAVYRTLSRDHIKRQAENGKFVSLLRPLFQWARHRRMIHRDKDHRYFKCPNCGQQLRAPKGKGRIHVTCRSCGVSFEENT